MFHSLTAPEPDQILRLIAEFAADPRPDKIDLGVGVYRNAEGATPIMHAVRDAERRLLETETTKTYTGVLGDPAFLAAIAALVLGPGARGDRLAACATPGGTGAVRQAFELIARARPGGTVWVTDPTWPNHPAMLDEVGLRWRSLRWLDRTSGAVDRAGFFADLAQVAQTDSVLLHGCCHNPSGADMTDADWAETGAALARTGALPMVDLAYQGFGKGIEADVAGLRLLVAAVPEAIVAVSGSKNFGLYRERVGAVLALAGNAPDAAKVRGTLFSLNRLNYTFPPDHGARIVTTILGDETLRGIWQTELDAMRTRVADLRRRLADCLRSETQSDRFGYLAENRGMFSLIPADPVQIAALRETHAMYVVGGGRINLAGLTEETAPRAARAMASVLA